MKRRIRFSPGEVGDVTRTMDPKLIFACITPTERSLIGESINLSSPLVPVPDEVMFEFKPVTNAIS